MYQGMDRLLHGGPDPGIPMPRSMTCELAPAPDGRDIHRPITVETLCQPPHCLSLPATTAACRSVERDLDIRGRGNRTAHTASAARDPVRPVHRRGSAAPGGLEAR